MPVRMGIRLAVALVYLMLTINCAHSANILCLLGTPSAGHHIWNKSVLGALAARGHNLTVLGVEPAERSFASRIHYIRVDNVYDAIYERSLVAASKKPAPWPASFLSRTVYGEMTGRYADASKVHSTLVDSAAARRLLNYPLDFRFDLVLHDCHQAQVLLGYVDRFDYPPLVSLSPAGIRTASIGLLSGAINLPSYLPHVESPYVDHQMTFVERARNLSYYLFDWFYRSFVYMVNENRKAKRLFGPDLPKLEMLEARSELVLVNVDFLLDDAFPLPPNVVPVGGLQAQRNESLDYDLQRFLDDSKNGVIYINLGFMPIDSSQFVPKRTFLRKVFKELSDFDYIWSTDEEFDDLPDNVFTGQWFPQNAILAHPNVRLMITHGGRLSVQEAVWHGVPLLAITTNTKQQQMVHRVRQYGCADTLLLSTLKAGQVVERVQKAIQEPSCSIAATMLSKRMRMQPSSPLERAVHWIEFVLQNGEAKHLRPNDAHLYHWQIYQLDVWTLCAMLVITFAVMLIVNCCRRSSSDSDAEERYESAPKIKPD